MTLLIAGYQFDRAFQHGYAWHNNAAAAPKLDAKPSGIFMVADSAITSGNETLLNGFRKIYSVPVKLWTPYFVGNHFQGYKAVQQEFEVIVGFAGSTLTAQHYLNGLTEHLGKLRISCRMGAHEGQQYVVLMNCEKNILEDDRMAWDEYDFAPNDIKNLLTAEKISEVALHSFEHSMRSVKRYKLSMPGLQSLITPFVVGIQCPLSKKHSVFVYRMNLDMVEGVYQVKVAMSRLGEREVAVLGMEKEFGDAAQAAYGAAIGAGTPPAHPMFDFLCASIDQVVERGGKEISHPAAMKTLLNSVVETVKRSTHP